MAEILSQNQIDELLNELAGGTKADIKPSDITEGAKPYDFKSPKKLSRDQNKMLAGFVDVLSRHLAAYFAGLLRNYCEITTASIEEQPYYEYNNSLSDSLMTGIVDISHIGGTILLDMSNILTFTFVERMLGGGIEGARLPQRDFSEIEITLMERVFKRICMFIQDTFQGEPDAVAALRQIETNPRFIKAIRIEEIVEVIVLNVVIGPIKGTITACIPYTYVDPLMGLTLQKNEKTETAGVTDESKNVMMEELNGTFVDVCAILGNVRLTLGEMMNLQPGDVLKLDSKVGKPVLVTVNGNKWFWGEPGVKSVSKAIKLNKYFNG